MWLFIIIYVIFLVIEAIAEVVKLKKGKNNTVDSFLPTILGFSFAASSINSQLFTLEDTAKILFAYSIVYTIYWMGIYSVKSYFNKK